MTFRYSLYGLSIDSDIALAAPAAPPGAADLRIRSGPMRAVPREPAAGEVLCHVTEGDWGVAHVRTAQGYTLRYFGTAEFTLNPQLDELIACQDPNAPSDLRPELLVAGVPTFKLLLSGKCVLHASAVARDDAALGILAPSGGGKSTLAAALCEDGFRVVTDDALVLAWSGDDAAVVPGPAELRLRPGSLAIDPARKWHAQRTTVDGRIAVSSGDSAARATPLRALVFPVLEDEDRTATLERMSADAALGAILGHLRVTGWRDSPVLQRIFPEQVRLARRVPAYRLVVPWGPAGLKAALALLRTLSEAQP